MAIWSGRSAPWVRTIPAMLAIFVMVLPSDSGPDRCSRFRPRLARLCVDVVGQAQHALADDVSLHLRRATPDGEGRREQKAVVPLAIAPADGTVAGAARQHSARTGQVLGQPHDVLP